MDAPNNCILSKSGLKAEFSKSEYHSGLDLVVDGVTQSNVVVGQPSILNLDYVRRLGDMIDHYFPVDAPISVLHLGAGAMTLVRYIGARNPDALQVVVELEKDIVDLVESVVPLEVPAEIIYMDAGDAVRALPPKSFDLIISDVYVGIDTPDHLMTKEFYSNLDSLLLPYGVLLVNVTGKDGLEFIAEQYKTIRCIFSNTVIAIDNESFSSGGETNALVSASPEDSAILDLEFPKEHRPSTTIIPGDWSL